MMESSSQLLFKSYTRFGLQLLIDGHHAGWPILITLPPEMSLLYSNYVSLVYDNLSIVVVSYMYIL